jgi:hypothetical protein
MQWKDHAPRLRQFRSNCCDGEKVLKPHAMTKATPFQVLPNVNDECCQLTMSSDDVDSVFFKNHLIKAESARLIVVRKGTFIRCDLSCTIRILAYGNYC